MTALEDRARQLGLPEAHLDTATNQPEAIAFYQSLGYQEVGREHQLSWTWTLVYFVKILEPGFPSPSPSDVIPITPTAKKRNTST
jgi:hypothetical protein